MVVEKLAQKNDLKKFKKLIFLIFKPSKGVLVFFCVFYYFLPKTGYIRSRLSYIIIFLISFFPLVTLIKKNKPDYFVAHLITSLPLILINLFNLKIKMILRISGFPKLNFFRKKLWKLSESKIFQVTCPTEDLHKN